MAALIIETGVYFIQNIRSGAVVDLKDGSTINSAPIQAFDKRELNNDSVSSQLWIICQSNPPGTYTIQNANGRSYATMDKGLAANGTPIVGTQPSASVTGNSNKWTITRTTDKVAYNIKNVESGTYMDLKGGGTANGTVIQGWTADLTNTNQRWLIVRA